MTDKDRQSLSAIRFAGETTRDHDGVERLRRVVGARRINQETGLWFSSLIERTTQLGKNRLSFDFLYEILLSACF